ncbi:MAG: hypothetical protein J0H99_13080, partial [Rhodospirillales bacterium]|nr:hypothetical protein [Rhodospirillales bacterium]
TAAAIQADLALGSGSRLLAHLSVISGIGISNAGTVSLTATQALVAGIDDGAGSAIAKLSGGSFVVTGATVAQIAAIAALSIAPSSITVSDTAAHLQADLASGSSALLAHAGLISTVVNADSGVIVLTVAQIRAAGVDDGPGSALAKLQGGSIAVAGAQLADIATLLALPIAPSSIAISDTAAAITADLASGSSLLLAHAAAISGIAVSDGGTISLTVAQISAAGVDDGAGSVLAKTTGGVLAVTGATVADLVPLAALTRTPTSITVVDTAAHIQADLAGGSPLLLANAGQITSISTIEASATFTLSVAQLAALPTVLAEIATPYQVAISDTAAHVEASLTGANSVLIQAGSSLSGITLTDGSLPTITLSVAALSASTTVLPLIGSSYHLDVADTTSAVQADLAAAVSVLRAEAATLHAVAVTGGTVLSLTAIQVLRSGVATVLAVTSGLTNVLVTGVAISQVATIAGLGIGQLLMAISDSGAALEADLTSGTPVLVSNVSSISGISLTDGTTPTLHLQVAQLAAAATVIARIGTPFAIAISDTAAHVQSDLASGGSVLLAHAGALTGITLTDGGVPPIALSMTQVDAASAVLALIGGSFALSIADTAANVQADLTSATPTLLAMLPDLAGITLTDGGSPTITLTVAQIAADAAALSLIGSSWTLGVQDTAAHVQVDLAAGALSEILARLGRLGTVTLTSGSTITLTEAQATYSGVATVLAAIGNLGSLVVTGVAVAQISTVLGLGIGSTSMQVVDSAANVQSDLTGAGTLLTNVSQVSAITLTDVTPIITLTIAQVSADNAVLARIGMPWHLAIADTAAHLQSDLAAGATSELLGHAAVLSGVTLTSGTSITLTEAQVTYAGVAGVLAATTGLTSLAVTGVAVAQIPTVLGLGIANTSLTIVDTAAQVQSDLTGPGALLTHASQISAITLTDGGTPTFVFSIAQVAADEALLSRIGVPWQLAILDTAAHLQADLAAGASSELLTYGATLTNATLIIVTLTSPATITLTESEVTRAGVATVLQATTGLLGLDVTGVTVGQISTVRGLGIANTRLAISDTAANVQADLTGGSSLLADGTIAPTLTALTLTDGSAPTLTLSIAQTTAAATALSLICTTWHLAISDTAANVQSDLASGGASTLLARATVLSGVALTSGTTITLTEAQATRAGVASVLAATTGLSSFVVTGATI